MTQTLHDSDVNCFVIGNTLRCTVLSPTFECFKFGTQRTDIMAFSLSFFLHFYEKIKKKKHEMETPAAEAPPSVSDFKSIFFMSEFQS